MRLEQLSLQRRRLLLHAGRPDPAARSRHADRIAQHDVVVHRVRGTTKIFYVRGTSRASQLLDRVTEVIGWPRGQCFSDSAHADWRRKQVFLSAVWVTRHISVITCPYGGE